YETIRGAGPFSAGNAAGAASAYLKAMQVALPAGSYPNVTRAMTLQAQVRAITKAKGAVVGREIAWVVPLLLAQRLQSAGDFQGALDFADAEFTRETDESIAHARSLYVTARRLLGAAALQPQQPTNAGEPALPIPELESLRSRAELQLAKLRQGRNIAGMPRT